MKMRRVLALFLCLVLALTLTACKSSAAKSAEALIDAIGEVTAESEAAIKAAEDALQALGEKERAQVENSAALEAARNALGIKKAEALIDAIGEVTMESEAAVTAAEDALAGLTDAQRGAVSNAGVLAEAREKLDAALEEARLQAARQELAGVWLHRLEMGPMMGQLIASSLEAQEFGGYGLSFPDYLDSYVLGMRLTLSDDGTYVLEADADVMATENEKLGKAVATYLSDVAVRTLGEEFVKQGILAEMPVSWEDMESVTTEDAFFQAVFQMSREELGSYYGDIMGSSMASSAAKESGTWTVEDGRLLLSGTAGSISYDGTVEYTLENGVMTWTGGTMPLTTPMEYPTVFEKIS